MTLYWICGIISYAINLEGVIKMKLTSEQSLIVEQNHNLIYWYANMRHIDIQEWYDLLAIELCLAVQKFNPEKSSLSNYYKIRCDNLVAKEYTKSQYQKNAHNGHVEMEDHINMEAPDDLGELLDLNILFEGPFGEIIRLKADGYTQSEIAHMVGVTQSYVSKVITKVKEDYYASK